jgi:hypothetical protein
MSVPLRFDTLIRTTPSKGSCESLDVRAARRVVISTIIGTGQAEDKVKTITDAYQKSTAPAVLRSRERIERLFGDLDLIAPGLVPAPEWHPDVNGETAGGTSWVLAGVGRIA